MSDCNTCEHNIKNPPQYTCDVYGGDENNFYIKLVHDKNGNEVEIYKIKLSEYIDKIASNIVDALIPSEKN